MSRIIKDLLTLQNDWLYVHITQEDVRFLVVIVLGTLHIVAIAVLHDADGIFDEVETNVCHNASVCHVADVHLGHLQVALAVLLQVERQNAMSGNVQLLLQILDATVAELVDAVLVEETAEMGVTCHA